jgi:hypothetical protein
MIISRRFRGPPSSANGGYACGVVAGLLPGGDAEATLRVPPPLERDFVEERGDTRAVIRDGDTVVAEAVATTLELEVPPPVTFEEAERATHGYPWFERHPYPGCFVCGPAREAPDALRILPGAVAGREIAAAPWVPSAIDADADGVVEPAILWAALDCPSWFGFNCFHPMPENGVLLGRLAARIVERPRVGERLIAAGWFLGRDGRKISSGSALFAEDGTVRGFARATWIALR